MQKSTSSCKYCTESCHKLDRKCKGFLLVKNNVVCTILYKSVTFINCTTNKESTNFNLAAIVLREIGKENKQMLFPRLKLLKRHAHTRKYPLNTIKYNELQVSSLLDATNCKIPGFLTFSYSFYIPLNKKQPKTIIKFHPEEA